MANSLYSQLTEITREFVKQSFLRDLKRSNYLFSRLYRWHDWVHAEYQVTGVRPAFVRRRKREYRKLQKLEGR